MRGLLKDFIMKDSGNFVTIAYKVGDKWIGKQNLVPNSPKEI